MKIEPPLQARPHSAPELAQPSGISPVELQLIINGRVNTLLVGSAASLSAALTALRAQVVRPIALASGAEWRTPTGSPATLIVENISALSAEGQRAMLDWLDSPSRPAQVISTSERPLFELVERGTFSDRLFYRLNMMYLQL